MKFTLLTTALLTLALTPLSILACEEPTGVVLRKCVPLGGMPEGDAWHVEDMNCNYDCQKAGYNGDLIKSESADINAINTHLLSQVHNESIPVIVYEIWFHIAVKHAPELLHGGLTDRISCGVRKTSLHALRRRFHSRKWKDTWDLLGGAAGLKEIIDNAPLSDVNRLKTAILAIKFQGPRDVVSTCVEELPRLAAESDRATGRLISPTLAPLIQLCSERYLLECIERQGQQGDFSRHLKEIARLHMNLLRRIVVGTVEVSEDLRLQVFQSQRESLVRSPEEYVPVYLPSDMTADIHPGMAFCLDMVHALSANAGFKGRINSVAVLDLIHSTLKLAAKKRCSLDTVLKFVKHILPTYFEHTDHRTRWTMPPLPREILRWWSIARTGKIQNKSSFWLRSIVSHNGPECFSLHRELLEDLLLQTLRQQADRRFSVRKDPREFHRSLNACVSDIPSEERLTFMKFLCRNLPPIDVDLDTWPPSERESQLFPHWGLETLRALPTSDAEWLFGRMLAIHGCEEFLPDPDGASRSKNQMTWTEQCLLKIDWELEDDTSGRLPVTRKVLAESKRRATRDRDPQGRLTWATASLQFAIASKSLDIFQETVEWSRRFLRDPVVFPGLLHILFSSRTASILSCTRIPGPRSPKTLPEFKAVVGKSNEVLRSYLDIAHLIVREPHYKRNLTRGIPSLFSGIISQRIDGFETSPGTESERVDSLLYSLLPIILEFERLANSEDTGKFSWSGFSGAVSRMDSLDDVHEAVLSFLDRMAYERNQFWVEKRRDDNPEIMDLPLGFPRGLPLEYLLPSLKLAHLANEHPDDMPYVASRLADVMVPSSVMLNVIPASVARKNYPVDDLSYGVRAVIEDPSKAVKEKKLLQIWERFSDALRPYPDQLEIFKEWLADLARRERLWNAVNKIQPPVPPRKFSVTTYFEQCCDMDHVIEWDPRPAPAPVDIASTEPEPEERKVERTILICRINAADRSVKQWRFLRSCTSTLNQQKKRILRRPWPENVSSPRYPAIFLADEFLTAVAARGNRAIYAAKNALEECLKFVPAQLLRDVVVSLLQTLAENSDKKQPSYSTILTVTMRLIKLLQETDQPQLAFDIDAALMVNTFADFVCNTGKPQPASKKTQPYVKITTIKMLAQLLAEAAFIDISTCLRILQNIFDSSQHIDVRSEVVITVLRLFPRAADFTSVFNAMASMANAASGPSEREVMSETDWLAAENRERPLPEVAPVSDRPLFECFLKTAFHCLPEQHRREYLHKVNLTPDEDNAVTSLSKVWAFDPSAMHTLFCTWRRCKPFAAIGDSIAAGVQTQVENGITVSDLVDDYICRAGIVSRHPVRLDKKLDRLVVGVSRQTSLESLTILKKEMRFVSNRGRYDLLQAMMERIVAEIESLRMAQWKEDPSRSPAVLPSRLEMDMLLLPLPGHNPRTKDPAMEFGKRFLDLVKKFADDPLLLVDFDVAKAQVNSVKEKDLASFALLFGSDAEEDQETLYRRLKVDIARCALKRIKSEDLRQNRQLWRMIRRWKGSSSEWVRQVGWSFNGSF
ncbi:hypothetical protein CNMCM6106_006696 [Aspergillus hiratsukae]|nr:hypothetical protein CNMCM6106_006696 [Aspergillus hiratsukae]